MCRTTRTDLKSVKGEGVQSSLSKSLMSISRSKVISWMSVMTSGAREVKLGLAVREDEEVMLPWLVPIPPVSETTQGG